MLCLPAATKGRKTGRCSPRWSRPASDSRDRPGQSADGKGTARAKVVGKQLRARARRRPCCGAAAGLLGRAANRRLHSYRSLADAKRADAPVTLAFCWAHWRRQWFDLAKSPPAPIAAEVLKRIAELYEIEAKIRGKSANERRVVRQEKTKPLVATLKTWLEKILVQVASGSSIAQAIRYGLNHWDGLVRFLDDGRIEIASNTVERSVRPIALNRKNALFAVSDEGAENWAMLASLVETVSCTASIPKPI